MARAAFAVDMWRMIEALWRRQMAPSSAVLAMKATSSRRVIGNSGRSAKNRAFASLLGKQRIGLLWATPRGSKPMMSNRARMAGGETVVGGSRVLLMLDAAGGPRVVCRGH